MESEQAALRSRLSFSWVLSLRELLLALLIGRDDGDPGRATVPGDIWRHATAGLQWKMQSVRTNRKNARLLRCLILIHPRNTDMWLQYAAVSF